MFYIILYNIYSFIEIRYVTKITIKRVKFELILHLMLKRNVHIKPVIYFFSPLYLQLLKTFHSYTIDLKRIKKNELTYRCQVVAYGKCIFFC